MFQRKPSLKGFSIILKKKCLQRHVNDNRDIIGVAQQTLLLKEWTPPLRMIPTQLDLIDRCLPNREGPVDQAQRDRIIGLIKRDRVCVGNHVK